MHMGNELLTPAVGLALIGISGGVLTYAGRKASGDLDEGKVPLMGVMGAFVFAAQMINFPILAGTSGHLVGGMLLVIILGPHIAALVMASILIIQCLIFQDGGLLALGANILNLGIVPAYLGTMIYQGVQFIIKGAKGKWTAVFISAFFSVVLGALLVPVEVAFAGVYNVPFYFFMMLMGGVHILIGIVEGLVTVMVVSFIYQIKPEALVWTNQCRKQISFRGVTLVLLAVTLFISGYLSYYASSSPDGLEWVTGRLGFEAFVEDRAGEEQDGAVSILPKLPDYEIPDKEFQEEHPHLSRGLSGAIGSVIIILVLFIIGAVFRRRNKETAH